MAAYYKYSGKFKAEGIVLGFLAGAAISIPAAFLYDYAIVSIPMVKVRIFCTLAFGAVIGIASGIAMCWGKVRNTFVACAVSFASSLLGLYLSWIAWIMHLLTPSRWIFNVAWPAMFPESVWRAMLEVNKVGTWGYEHSRPDHGTFLWIVWFLEALLVLAAGTMTARYWVHRRPFCERCDQWCTEQRKLYFAPILFAADFKNQLESQDMGIFAKLTVGDKKKAHFRIDLESCGICHSVNTISLFQVFPRDRKTVVNKLLVTPEQTSAICNLELSQRVASSAAALPVTAK